MSSSCVESVDQACPGVNLHLNGWSIKVNCVATVIPLIVMFADRDKRCCDGDWRQRLHRQQHVLIHLQSNHLSVCV